MVRATVNEGSDDMAGGHNVIREGQTACRCWDQLEHPRGRPACRFDADGTPRKGLALVNAEAKREALLKMRKEYADKRAQHIERVKNLEARTEYGRMVRDFEVDPALDPLDRIIGLEDESVKTSHRLRELEATEKALLDRLARLEAIAVQLQNRAPAARATAGDVLCERCAGVGRLYQMQPGNYQFLPVRCDACQGSGRATA
jgi:hypothetical protein